MLASRLTVFLGHFASPLPPSGPRPPLPSARSSSRRNSSTFCGRFVLAGIERFEIAPGITAVTPLDFVSYPYSHSLLTSAVWAGLFGGIYLALRRNTGAALVLAALVLSHWLLDAASHRPDMPLAPGGGTRVGLGLWDSLPATLAVEGLLFAACLWSYLRVTRAKDRVGSVNLWTLVAVLLLAYFGAVFGPPPPSVDASRIRGFWRGCRCVGLLDRPPPQRRRSVRTA